MLNVSQRTLETEYYMIDLRALLEQKRKYDAMQRLQDVQLALATNNRSVEDAEFKSLIKTLNNSLGVKHEEKFSREKFEELRRFTEMNG